VANSTDPKFTPAWWLRGAHPQTLWSQFFRRGRAPELRHERIATPDGDHLSLYHRDVASNRPRLLILHGLEGSERSHYVAGFVAQASRRGWNSTVLVFRGCGSEFNAAPRLYHSGETSDLGFVAELLTSRAPGDSLILAGVSLGGNVLLKWLGELADRPPVQVRAAAAVSVPFDLELGCKNLQQGFARLYDRHFLKSLRDKARRKLEQHPGLFDAARLEAATTIEGFDDAVTGPVHGFDGSHDYYRRSSSISFIGRIQVPTLLLSAEDDPFLPGFVLDRVQEIAKSNPSLHLQFTPTGGHVGFVTGRTPFRPVYWAEERLMTFLDSQLCKLTPRP
jgi:predicted alpha/beta-fold hydrolase